MQQLDIIIRFSATFLLALLFGLERHKAHKPIGFGTFVFVSVGSCGLAITAMTLSPQNPLPLLSGIVTGIGFLGAGALIKTTNKIFGFTSAATIWVFAIFGLLIGIGQFFMGIGVYLIIWIIMLIDKNLEERGIGSYQKKLVIKTSKIVSEKEVKDVLIKNSIKNKLICININKSEKSMILTYSIEGGKESLNKIPDMLYNTPWMDFCNIE
ncbi:MAG: MgtC/SapB family protein [Candidatus Nanoarchaeia archaeon]|nr:MgtC/SapB family protein [Candidatus Nanoarchaeia archaeon]